ncbi:MAG: hypothetical protein AUK16_00170 [Parcubacteria group bacterium CG2_30_44_11]|nr:MAG: hypothetical protein AUK16_00170 [Parcubacteria group bacterium CG2_30_44_11]
MSLHEDFKTSLKEAMKAKEAVKLSVIRGLLTAFMNELVATNRKPQEILTDNEVLTVIKRAAKQRKESIVQYEAAKRLDLSEPEKAELAILETYLPTLMNQEEITPFVQAKMTELSVTDKSKMGMLVGAVMKELSGKADGADVKAVVEGILS